MPILQFLKNPTFDHDKTFNIKNRFYKTIFYFLTSLSITLILSIFLNLLMSKYGIKEDQNLLYNLFGQNKRWYIFLMVVITWPILEEMIFRSILRPNIYILYIWITWVWYIFTKKLLPNFILSEYFYNLQSYYYNYIYWILGILLIIWLLWLIFLVKWYIYYFCKKYFSLLFYLSAIIFGLVHISNFSKFVAPWYVYVLLILPQMMVGLFLWFVRVRFGLWFAILYHMLHNGILSFVLIYSLFLWINPTNISQINLSSNSQLSIGIIARSLVLMTMFVVWTKNIYTILSQKD